MKVDFNEIIESIRTFKGVTRKHTIADVRETLAKANALKGAN